mmetsp:Transcript_3716/g.8609  ORF Transcript_3716/g.8609 Transcript_3716/m.8609 type:complete len:220 (-) Transcript_3716:52-711(-)
MAASSVMTSLVCWVARSAAACWANRAFLAFSSRRLRSLAQDFCSIRKTSRGTSDRRAHSSAPMSSSSSSLTVRGLALMRALINDLLTRLPWAAASMSGVSPRLSRQPAAAGWRAMSGSTTSAEAPEAVAMCSGVRPVESMASTREGQSVSRSVTTSRGGSDANRMCRMSRAEFWAYTSSKSESESAEERRERIRFHLRRATRLSRLAVIAGSLRVHVGR